MSLWQTIAWQKMLQKSGQIEQFFEVDGVFVEKRQVSLGEFGLFVIGHERELSAKLETSLIELCQKQNCLFIQVETLDYSSPTQEIPVSTGMIKSYYKKFIPPHTAVIDLTKTEEEILAAMKPKGRYNIRLAEKKGVVVEQVEKNPHTTKVFFELMQETTSRDSFAGNSLSYYETFLTQIEDSQLFIEDSQLFFAYYEKRVIAAGIFVTSGDTMIYYYGASSSQHRNLMAPYLLQWTAISHAKKRGLQLYDFLGIASPDEKNSSLAGVTDFKLKLTPDSRKVSESFLWVNKKWKYRLIQLLKKLKK